MSKPLPTPAQVGPDAAQYEEDAVHGVYEAIAPHFSRTRYKVSHPESEGEICHARAGSVLDVFVPRGQI